MYILLHEIHKGTKYYFSQIISFCLYNKKNQQWKLIQEKLKNCLIYMAWGKNKENKKYKNNNRKNK